MEFFDTNVLVYCTDSTAPHKQAMARTLVARSSSAGSALVSTQVLIELTHTLSRKQRMPPAAAQALTEAYAGWRVVDSLLQGVRAAMTMSVQHQLSIWDAMVIEAAQRGGAQTLYSEDLSHGQRFGSVTIVNPFQAVAA